MDEAAVVRVEKIAALAFRYVARERAPRLGKDRAEAVEEPVDLALAAQEDPAQHERAAALRMVLRVGQSEGRAPRAAEHHPLVDGEVRAQPLEVGDQVLRGV